METAQRLVDEAARMAGYDRKLFHGTNATETVEGKSTPGSAEAIANLESTSETCWAKGLEWDHKASISALRTMGSLASQEDAANARKWQAEATGSYEKSREKLSFDVFSPLQRESWSLAFILGMKDAGKNV